MKLPVMEMKSVSFSYARRPEILTNVNLRLREGEFTVVTGPSGGGKTTFLRLLCRLESPTAGEIFHRGTPLGRFCAPALRRKVAYLQQVPIVLPATVAENLRLPFTLKHSEPGRPTDAQLDGALARVGLSSVRLDDPAEELSVGQKQRLCLVRTLLMKPDALLLDEPLSALDADAMGSVLRLLGEMNRSDGTTIVMVSHTGGRAVPAGRRLELTDRSFVEQASAG